LTATSRLSDQIMHRRISIFLCLFLGAGLCGASGRRDPQGRFPFRTFASEQGLDNLAVNAILQDRTGFLWVGTEDGLYRYDGDRFERVASGDGEIAVVTALTEDSAGRLYVGTYDSLFFLEGDQFRKAAPSSGPLNARINALATSRGTVFAATSAGLYRVATPDLLEKIGTWPDAGPSALWADGDGTVLVGDTGRIRALHPDGRWETRAGFGDEKILAIARDGSGSLWIRSMRHLWTLPQGVADFHDESAVLPGGTEAGTLTVDPTGDLWVPTSKGLLHRHAQKWDVVATEQGLPTGWSSHAFVDAAGSLWVGSIGLYQQVGRGLWRSHTVRTGLPSELVWTVFRHPDGHLWVGTDRGVARSEGGAWKPVPGTERHSIRTIARTPDGAMWMAGSPAELLRLDPRTNAIDRFGTESGITGTHVLKIFVAADGRLWVATVEGLLRRADGPGRPRFEHVALPEGIPIERFASIAEDASGRLWAAGRQGLAVLEGGSWHRFTQQDGLRATAMAYVLHRRSGETCATYYEAKGVTCFQYRHGALEHLRHIDTTNGLENGRVYLVGEDIQERLWVGTGKGVDVFSARGTEHFDTREGLVGDDCAAMAFLAEADGTVWIGTSAGLSQFDGAAYQGPSGPPFPALLSSHVDARAGAFEVRFAGLAFAHRGEVKYQVRLVPVEQDWRGTEIHEARYTHLPPGPYTFEMRARIGTGPWSPEAATTFRILPAWWQTFWFRLLVGVAGIALAAMAMEWRSRAAEVRKTREARARTEASFRALIERNPDAILVHRDGVLVYLNLAAVKMLGYDEAESLLGRRLVELVHPEDRASIQERSAMVAATGKASPLREHRLLRRDGGTVVVEKANLAVEFAGAPSVLSVARDVTERKQLHTRLLLSDRMASIGTLAAGVAHEVNNPLACVKANLDFLAEGLGSGIPQQELVAALDDALDGAERVRRIVRGLKLFSRADEEQRRPLELERVLEIAIRMCGNEIRHRARLVKNYQPVPLVQADESRLAQVFINLLANAAQSIPEGHAGDNEILLTMRTDEAGSAVVEVRDTGQGIPAGIVSHVFDPFFTTKPVGEGTGLGLAICHGIVTALGGEIGVASVVGKGTTFRVTLPPATQTASCAAVPAAVARTPTPRSRVLVVDDDPRVGASVHRSLAREHDVQVLSSAHEALRRIQQGERFDVFLCDLMMPELTGMDLHAEVSRVAPDQGSRMIFITGGAFTPAARQFLDTISNPRLEKPFGLEELRAMVRSVA